MEGSLAYYLRVHVYTYTHVHLYTYTHIHVYTCTPIHIYIYTHIHLYTLTHVHTYVLMGRFFLCTPRGELDQNRPPPPGWVTKLKKNLWPQCGEFGIGPTHPAAGENAYQRRQGTIQAKRLMNGHLHKGPDCSHAPIAVTQKGFLGLLKRAGIGW